jgi:DEAD/DEAH box helicase domain-containing protein
MFKGPYLSLQLPFRDGSSGRTYFPEIPLRFPAYRHQERAFERLSADPPRPTIVATGTGSGKTESFLVPILDHCRKHAGTPGIKAVLIYPMNALATDQARRIARIVDGTPSLRGKVRAGLYIGSRDAEPRMNMAPDGIITDRETLRLHPPDILLTNYKMLDYLLVRPHDATIWEGNAPGALRYLVVDELHTFDGAQGTDLACLIRRLKARLGAGDVCAVGTSATLGGQSGSERLRAYAKAIFDTSFDADAVATEERLSAAEFLGDALIRHSGIPADTGPGGPLDPATHDSHDGFVAAQYEAWFGEHINPDELESAEQRLELGGQLKGHATFQNLLRIVGAEARAYGEVVRQLGAVTPGLSDLDAASQVRVLDSLLALVSVARRPSPSSNGTTDTLPLVNVGHQLWMRELRRLVSTVSTEPRLAWSDDLKELDAERALPVIHCRECGTTGWGGMKRHADGQLNPDLDAFYRGYFKGRTDPRVTLLFPDAGGELADTSAGVHRLVCPACLLLSLDGADSCPGCGTDRDELVRVYVPDYLQSKDGFTWASLRCPSCASRYGLSIVGSQAASLTAVMIGQLYASTYNDDKKLLTFSDSVQDASHRAGFFQARTYQFTLRSALQQFVESSPASKTLPEIARNFIASQRAALSAEAFVGLFIPPDMTWLEDYEVLDRTGSLPAGSDLPELVARRLSWEITSEYGFRSRVGRTLEKTAASMASPRADIVEAVRNHLLEPLRNEIGGLDALEATTLERFIAGAIDHMRTAGGIYHDTLDQYIGSFGNTWLISRIPFMPRFGRSSRAPSFPCRESNERFDRILGGKSRSWYQSWTTKCLTRDGVLLPPGFEDHVLERLLPALEQHGILQKHDANGHAVWSLRPDALEVSADIDLHRCDRCSHSVSAPAVMRSRWDGTPCLRATCTGSYSVAPPEDDYYRRLYRTAEIRRIVAAEHTGLLKREDRELLEERFMHSSSPWDPNLISCTPTLEMGIDIGDLSSLILCSVPPGQANYLQRIGRAGRRDGNALSVTVANGKPHDLYFFAEPREMLAGDVEPPGTFLDAPAVLERQLSAYCFDRWVQGGISAHAVPPDLGKVLNSLDKEGPKQFPRNWIGFIEANRDSLLAGFLALFSSSLSELSTQHLTRFIRGDVGSAGSLAWSLLNSLHRKRDERASIRRKADAATALIKKLDEAPRDKNYDETRSALLRERSALRHLVTALNKTNVYNFLTDEGLLPNYAFPEAGVTLQSVIYRKKAQPDDGGAYDTWTLSFERSGASAIRELAPESTFYAGGRKVRIDQVDLGVSDVEDWRLCSECAHAQMEATVSDPPGACPRCGSETWSDGGRVRPMVRLKQVFATTSDRESRSHDDSDERDRSYFHQQMAVESTAQDVTKAFVMTDESLPYGFEFLRRASFREVNYGEMGEIGEPVRIAGVEIPRRGFELCTYCGKVQKHGKAPEHALTCTARDKTADDNFSSCVYLYREFSSEAIRMLLPFTTAGATATETQSFIAGLHLGLKKRFGGQIDHLQVTMQEEPITGSEYRRQYLFLYDTVPGGTGYLKELMREPAAVFDVLERAVAALSACSCNQDPEKDGCYRCLYAYRHSWQMKSISRTAAMDVFSRILERRAEYRVVATLDDVDMNVLLQSELEKRFVKALKAHCDPRRGESLVNEIVKGKPGFVLKLRDRSYRIEPQVSVGEKDGVRVPCKADLVLWPIGAETATRPIVIFTDGFAYHKDRIGLDTAQRMALLRSGKFLVWSVTWSDVAEAIHDGDPPFEDYIPLDHTRPRSSTFSQFMDALDAAHGTKKLSGVSKESSFEWLLRYLRDPDEVAWTGFAFVHSAVNLSGSADATWRVGVEAHAPDFVAEAAVGTPDDLAGHYQRVRPGCATSEIDVFARIPKAAAGGNDMPSVTCLVHLDDAEASQAQPGYERAWSGFLRVMNLYQFLPGAFFCSSSGLADREYDPLDVVTPPHDDFGWMEAAGLAVGCSELIQVLSNASLPAPEVGYELVGPDGAVLASAELAWPAKKVAVQRPDESATAQEFVAAGWFISSVEAATAQPQKLIDRLES